MRMFLAVMLTVLGLIFGGVSVANATTATGSPVATSTTVAQLHRLTGVEAFAMLTRDFQLVCSGAEPMSPGGSVMAAQRTYPPTTRALRLAEFLEETVTPLRTIGILRHNFLEKRSNVVAACVLGIADILAVIMSGF